ncbi:hypothetical protein AJ87_32590 [Rhizobium yanglingense]|nr:hypothetical protein AJ87_32590 [Rhizobium yanglingense]
MADVARDRRRVENMAEIDGENGGDDEPGLDVVPEKSMPTIWLAPAYTVALISVSSPSDMPLSTASAPNSAAKGADATATVKPPRKPSTKSPRLIGSCPPSKTNLLYVPGASAAIEFP